MTWWSEWREVYFQLSTLGTPDWEKPEAQRKYNSGDFTFTHREIDGHDDEIEEQLWAFRRGLTDIAFWIEIPGIPVKKKRRAFPV